MLKIEIKKCSSKLTTKNMLQYHIAVRNILRQELLLWWGPYKDKAQ